MAAPFAACCGAPREPVRCERAKESKGSLSLSLQQQIAARAALLCICQILLCLAVCFSALRAMLRQTERCRANTTAVPLSLSLSLSGFVCVCVYLLNGCVSLSISIFQPFCCCCCCSLFVLTGFAVVASS